MTRPKQKKHDELDFINQKYRMLINHLTDHKTVIVGKHLPTIEIKMEKEYEIMGDIKAVNALNEYRQVIDNIMTLDENLIKNFVEYLKELNMISEDLRESNQELLGVNERLENNLKILSVKRGSTKRVKVEGGSNDKPIFQSETFNNIHEQMKDKKKADSERYFPQTIDKDSTNEEKEVTKLVKNNEITNEELKKVTDFVELIKKTKDIDVSLVKKLNNLDFHIRVLIMKNSEMVDKLRVVSFLYKILPERKRTQTEMSKITGIPIPSIRNYFSKLKILDTTK